MTHEDEGGPFGRRFQPAVKIVHDLIDRLQRRGRLVTLAMTGVVITAHPRKTRYGRLDRRPIPDSASARRNEDHRRGMPGVAVAIDGNTAIRNTDHPLLRPCDSSCRQQ